jgi:hypothetical protein
MDDFEPACGRLARLLGMELDRRYVQHAGGATCFYGAIFGRVDARCRQDGVHPGDVLAGGHPVWHFGTVLHRLVTHAFNPVIMRNMPTVCLTEVQARELAFVMYMLCVEYGLNVHTRNALGQTALECMEAGLESAGPHVPAGMLVAVPVFRAVLRHGAGLKLMQNYAIQRCLRRAAQRRRRKAAGLLIARRALEVVLSPYTRVGRRLLARRSEAFYALAAKHDTR